jgi:hypothetical protein
LQLNNLYDMQHMWYEVRCGDAHLAAGALGKALKQYVAVAKHFGDFSEDQFDFHSYCVRKMTLRSYLGLLRLEDRLQHHPFYMRVSGTVTLLLLCCNDFINLVVLNSIAAGGQAAAPPLLHAREWLLCDWLRSCNVLGTFVDTVCIGRDVNATHTLLVLHRVEQLWSACALLCCVDPAC